VTLCPPSFGWMGVKTEASSLCCNELSAYCAVAVPRMFFSHWYTSPTPSVEGVGNVSKSAAITATFWLALAIAAPHDQSSWTGLLQALIHIGASWPVWPLRLSAHRQARSIAVRLHVRCHPIGRITVPPGEPSIAQGGVYCLVEDW
jgi:hypothetical protein